MWAKSGSGNMWQAMNTTLPCLCTRSGAQQPNKPIFPSCPHLALEFLAIHMAAISIAGRCPLAYPKQNPPQR